MNNNYFQPDISDIRVGYECEIKPRGSDMMDWMPYIINEDNAFHNYFLEGRGSTAIRVPYLTKEQIEAEGWEQRGDINYFYKKSTQKDKVEFGTEFLLAYYTPVTIPWIIIKAINPSWTKDDIVYQGRCKSINELRYICKLINI